MELPPLFLTMFYSWMKRYQGPDILEPFMFRPVNEPKNNRSILLPATRKVYYVYTTAY